MNYSMILLNAAYNKGPSPTKRNKCENDTRNHNLVKYA